MYDRRNNLCHQVEQDIRTHFQGEVFQTVIPRNVRLSEAPSHGKPVILYDINSSGAIAYMDVARELIRRALTRKSNEATTQGIYFNPDQNKSGVSLS